MQKRWETESFQFKDKAETIFRIMIEPTELPKIQIYQKEKVIEFETTAPKIKEFLKFFNNAISSKI
jgi:hypothetical protein